MIFISTDEAINIAFSAILAGLGSVGFGMFFGIAIRRCGPCLLGGILTWLAYRLIFLLLRYFTYITGIFVGNGISEFVANLIAAIVASTLARRKVLTKDGSASVFIFLAIVPLIPGGMLYRAVYALFNGQLRSAYEFLRQTIIIAGSIGIGVYFNKMINRKKTNIKENVARPTILDKHIADADRFYNIAKKNTNINPEKALRFYMETGNQYKQAISEAERTLNMLTMKDSEYEKQDMYRVKCDLYKKAGINYFWIYRTKLDIDAIYSGCDTDLQESTVYYHKAIGVLEYICDQEKAEKNRAELYNWLAVIKINMARHINCGDPENLLHDAEELLQNAIEHDDMFAKPYINMAEIFLAKICRRIGLAYGDPIYGLSIHFQELDSTFIETCFNECDKFLYKAMIRDANAINIYYKLVQVNTYKMLIHKHINDTVYNAAKQEAERWQDYVRSREPYNLGFLYIFRQYWEVEDFVKAKDVNAVINEYHPYCAKKWSMHPRICDS